MIQNNSFILKITFDFQKFYQIINWDKKFLMKFSYTPTAAATCGPHYQILVDFIFIIFIYFSYYLYRIQGGGVGCIE